MVSKSFDLASIHAFHRDPQLLNWFFSDKNSEFNNERKYCFSCETLGYLSLHDQDGVLNSII